MSRLGNGPFDDLAETAGFTGTDQHITVASTVYAIHGPYGIEDPKLGDLDALEVAAAGLRAVRRHAGSDGRNR